MAILELSKLKELDYTKQLAFAYLTCERLFPNYIFFSKGNNFGNPSVLREAIDYLKDTIFNKKYDSKKIKALIQNVESNIPMTFNYDTILASSALDACTAIVESLNFIESADFEKIECVLTFATDTIHMCIQETENLDFNDDVDFQSKINNHPLMRREIEIQSGMVLFLICLKNKKLDLGDLQTLIQLQNNNGTG